MSRSSVRPPAVRAGHESCIITVVMWSVQVWAMPVQHVPFVTSLMDSKTVCGSYSLAPVLFRSCQDETVENEKLLYLLFLIPDSPSGVNTKAFSLAER